MCRGGWPGRTTLSVWLNPCGGCDGGGIGAVSPTIGASFARISSTLTEGGIGPAPDDPVRVRCGGLYRDSRVSYRSLIARMRSAISAGSSVRMKIPFSGKHYSLSVRPHTSKLY